MTCPDANDTDDRDSCNGNGDNDNSELGNGAVNQVCT